MIENIVSAPPALNSKRLFSITEGVILFSLVTYAVFAPHSIAVTQAAFIIGLFAWGVQLVASGRLSQKRTPIDIAIFGFFACCVLSSFFSYDPMVSIKGLKSPALFFAFYFVCNKVTTLKLARFLAFAIVASCLVNVAYSAGQIAVGRGLRIDSIEADSPLARTGLRVGDVLLEADGKKVTTLEEMLQIADTQRGRIPIKYQRNESLLEGTISRRAVRKADDEGAGRLGITVSPGRNFRVTGLYSHYETYAEVLQLIAALAIGLLIAHPLKRSGTAWFLAVSVLLITVTLLLTSTRAAMIGLAAAAATMALASSRKRTVAIAILAIVVMAPAAMLAIERSRGSILFDPQEGSTSYRLEVWREALGLIKDHPLLGIGKGSEARLKEKLGLYDDGRLPPGHFHSTPIQIAAWWGLPALIFYFSLMAILIAEAWRLSRRLKEQNRHGAWGIVIGVLGALVAFNVSSLVHFNFGDGEVVMMIWLLTGLLLAVRRIASETSDGTRTTSTLSQTTEEDLDRSRPRELKVASGSSAQAAGARPNS